MNCIKCGGSVHSDALSCFHCGVSINHRANVQFIDWLTSESVAEFKKNRIRRFTNKIPVTPISRLVMWLSLIIPALLMPYIFKLSIEKYRKADSFLLDITLSIIVFSIFYFVKKAFYNPIHKK
jgi:hypothetical protein